MKYILIAGVLSVCIQIASGQETELYDLNKVNPPVVFRQGLEFIPDFSFFGHSATDSAISARPSFSFNTRNNGVLDLSSNYNYYLNSPLWQLEGNILFTTSGNIFKDSTEYSSLHYVDTVSFHPDYHTNNNNGHGFDLRVELNTSSRRYLIESFYCGLNLDIGLGYTKDIRKHNGLLTCASTSAFDIPEILHSTNRSNEQDIHADIIAGIGGINDVTYGAVGWYMLECAQKAGGTARNLTTHDIAGFAKVIERHSRSRVLDTRTNDIATVSALVEYIENNGLIDSISPRMVLELNDAWVYAFNQKRTCGFRFEFSPGFTCDRTAYHRKQSTTNTYYITTDTTGGPSPTSTYTITEIGDIFSQRLVWQYNCQARLSYARPVNRFLLFTADAIIKGGKNKTIDTSHHFSTNLNTQEYINTSTETSGQGILQIFGTIAWYPGIRTDVKFTNGLFLQKDFNDLPKISSIIKATSNYQSIDLKSGLSTGYYFSPQLYLRAGGSLNYQKVTSDRNPPNLLVRANWNWNISAKIIFKLF